MGCISAAKMNMTADILRPSVVIDNAVVVIEEQNEWVLMQDPDSGEIIRDYSPVPDDPLTPAINETVTTGTFKCYARGIMSKGIRATGTSEVFGEIYDNTDYVQMWLPSTVRISKRDKITNIRGSDGSVIWVEEELPGAPATVFNVMGVTPLPNPFGKFIEQLALLERADQQ